KTSTIKAKAEHINDFVKAIEGSGLSGNNAIFLKTPNNSFDKNLEALKTLQCRLETIKTMDVNSFQYQQAIQQITAQEQGEAQAMIDVFQGIWLLENYPLAWNWIRTVFASIIVTLSLVGIFCIAFWYFDF
ncbi:MAG: hypothetical protein PHY02_11065, partial [Phycisphaerae bacterium]|nr:hypothetical protein [Phycisphaerae bacterium]